MFSVDVMTVLNIYLIYLFLVLFIDKVQHETKNLDSSVYLIKNEIYLCNAWEI